MNILHRTLCFCGLVLISACAEEPPPVSVSEFMEDPRILEATMVRCARNRSASKYVADCVNAREAVNRLEAATERARREDLEKQSERKRQALRRTQEAAAEARRRALENQRRREEEEYLGLFDEVPNNLPDDSQRATDDNPGASGIAPATDVGPGLSPLEQPLQNAEDAIADPPTDLGAIREELRRRQEKPE